MHRLTRPARGLLVAVATLALTGGVVFAAQTLPTASSAGSHRATEASGKTVPVAGSAGAPAAAAQPAADTTNADPQAEDNATNADRPQNHGWFVSEAANGDTPAEFDSRGEYVSSIARGSAGKPDAAGNSTEQSAAGKARAAERSAAGKAKGDAAREARDD